MKNLLLPKHTKVGVNKWKSHLSPGLSYDPFIGLLLEPCNCTGWDVVDVLSDNGAIISVYSFSVYKKGS